LEIMAIEALTSRCGVLVEGLVVLLDFDGGLLEEVGESGVVEEAGFDTF
jgi:hypothetical protein